MLPMVYHGLLRIRMRYFVNDTWAIVSLVATLRLMMVQATTSFHVGWS